jgi:hypothetical protein
VGLYVAPTTSSAKAKRTRMPSIVRRSVTAPARASSHSGPLLMSRCLATGADASPQGTWVKPAGSRQSEYDQSPMDPGTGFH